MTEYTADDAARDLDAVRGLGAEEPASRLGEYLARLESRSQLAENVCRAAVEITTPASKDEPFQRRQTRFLQALAEWRESQR